MKKKINDWAKESGIDKRKLLRRLQQIQNIYPTKHILYKFPDNGRRGTWIVDMDALGSEIQLLSAIIPPPKNIWNEIEDLKKELAELKEEIRDQKKEKL
jgi:hypothetical protein